MMRPPAVCPVSCALIPPTTTHHAGDHHDLEFEDHDGCGDGNLIQVLLNCDLCQPLLSKNHPAHNFYQRSQLPIYINIYIQQYISSGHNCQSRLLYQEWSWANSRHHVEVTYLMIYILHISQVTIESKVSNKRNHPIFASGVSQRSLKGETPAQPTGGHCYLFSIQFSVIYSVWRFVILTLEYACLSVCVSVTKRPHLTHYPLLLRRWIEANTLSKGWIVC